MRIKGEGETNLPQRMAAADQLSSPERFRVTELGGNAVPGEQVLALPVDFSGFGVVQDSFQGLTDELGIPTVQKDAGHSLELDLELLNRVGIPGEIGHTGGK